MPVTEFSYSNSNMICIIHINMILPFVECQGHMIWKKIIKAKGRAFWIIKTYHLVLLHSWRKNSSKGKWFSMGARVPNDSRRLPICLCFVHEISSSPGKGWSFPGHESLIGLHAGGRSSRVLISSASLLPQKSLAQRELLHFVHTAERLWAGRDSLSEKRGGWFTSKNLPLQDFKHVPRWNTSPLPIKSSSGKNPALHPQK